ncbi:hypothetical protein [Candidatus Paracaedibacter symbiosus]|uniref:hypothetical protein n=1 Tax=Candidatus Paracaedibacter symbiosus TaxID=244582 RepID=UPI0005097744|nr:hypothetical protein [Candidatus Paracaedibacter symbiosus]
MKTVRFFCVFKALITCSLASTALENLSADQLIEKLPLVHLTSICPKNNTIIPGTSLTERKSFMGMKFGPREIKVFSKDQVIQPRHTLHFCIGGPVPSIMRGFRGEAKKSDLQTNDNTIALIEPFKGFLGEIYGGTASDIFSVGLHQFKNNSYALVPNHRLAEFKRENPNFLGKIYNYDPALEKIKTKIYDILEAHGLLKIATPWSKLEDNRELASVQALLNCTVTVGTEEVDNETFNVRQKEIFNELGIPLTSHSDTLFMKLEELLNPFFRYCVHFNEKASKEELAKLLLSPFQVYDLASMAQFFMAKSYESASHLNPARLKILEEWFKDIEGWLNLFITDANLREQGKKSLLLSDEVQDAIAKRQDLSFITSLKEKMKDLEEEAPLETILQETHFSAKLLPNVILEINQDNNFRSWLKDNSVEVKSLIKELTENGNKTLANSLVINSIFFKFMERIKSNNDVPNLLEGKEKEKFIKAVKETYGMPYPSLPARNSLKDMLREIVEHDQSPSNRSSVQILNDPFVLRVLNKIFYEATRVEPFTLQDIFREHPDTKLLYQEPLPDDFKYLGFFRDWLLEQFPPRSYKEANQLVNILKDSRVGILMGPKWLNQVPHKRISSGKDDIYDPDYLSFYNNLENGVFGSIQEIFNKLALGEEYRIWQPHWYKLREDRLFTFIHFCKDLEEYKQIRLEAEQKRSKWQKIAKVLNFLFDEAAETSPRSLIKSDEDRQISPLEADFIRASIYLTGSYQSLEHKPRTHLHHIAEIKHDLATDIDESFEIKKNYALYAHYLTKLAQMKMDHFSSLSLREQKIIYYSKKELTLKSRISLYKIQIETSELENIKNDIKFIENNFSEVLEGPGKDDLKEEILQEYGL